MFKMEYKNMKTTFGCDFTWKEHWIGSCCKINLFGSFNLECQGIRTLSGSMRAIRSRSSRTCFGTLAASVFFRQCWWNCLWFTKLEKPIKISEEFLESLTTSPLDLSCRLFEDGKCIPSHPRPEADAFFGLFLKKTFSRQTNSIVLEKCTHDIQQLDYTFINREYSSAIKLSYTMYIYIIPKQVSLLASPRS